MNVDFTAFETVIFDHVNDAVMATDLDYRLLRWNPAAERIYGWPAAEVIGKVATDVISVVRYLDGQTTASVLAAFHRDSFWQGQVVHRDRTGRELVIETSVRLVRDDDGTPRMIVAINRDLTARKQAEAALAESEERWRILSELTSDFSYAYLLLPDDTVVHEWTSSAFTRSTGFLHEELDARGWYELPVPEDRGFIAERRAALRAGRSHRSDYRIRTCEGTIRWLRDSARPMSVALPGGAIQVIGAAQDVTERKDAEERLRESERRLAEAQRIAHLGSWEADVSARRLTWSDELCRIFGIEPQQFDGTYAAYLARVHPADRDRILQQITRDLHDPQPMAHVYRIVRRDGQERIVQSYVEFEFDERGHVTKLMGTTQDVTDQQQAEERIRHEAARAEALLRVAARLNLALELDTLLTVMCEETADTLNMPIAMVGLYDQQDQVLTFAHAVGIPAEARHRLEPLPHHLFETRTHPLGRVLIPDLQVLPDGAFPELRAALDLCSAVAVDMRHHGQLVGVLVVGSRGTPRDFSSDELTLLQGLADQAAQAIANASLFQQLRTSGERLRRLTQQVVGAQEEERRRLSRELHDETGQALTGLRLSLEAALAELPPNAITADMRIREAIALTEATMDQIRLLAQDLRPPALDAVGLNLTLKGFCRSFARRVGLALAYAGTDVPGLPETIMIALYRFVQEALTNVARHAAATGVHVELDADSETVAVTITDDGQGFDQQALLRGQSEGLGLAGMRERIALLGGELEITSRRGRGTRLRARVPRTEGG